MPLAASRCAIAAALCLLFAGTAGAQDALLDAAAERLSRQDAPGAYAELAAQEDARAGDPRFDYLLGVSALDAGHVTRAIFALERALAVRPEDARTRAELGRAYLAAGEIDSARTELGRARRGDVPEAAAAAIDRVLGAMDQVAPAGGPRTVGYLEIGAGWDSNVNSASNTGEFALPAFGGIVYSPEPESRRQHDAFGTAAAGVSSQLALTPAWTLLAAANGRTVVNRRVHDMNLSLVDASVGVSHTAGAHAQTVALQTNTAWLSSSVYRTANGASAQWQSQFGPATQASVFGQWSRQEYAGQGERNTDRSVLGTGAGHGFGSTGTLAYGSVYLANERARNAAFDFNGHRATGVRVGVEQKVGASAVGYAEWQWERRRYGGTDPLFDVSRRERQSDFIAGVRLTLAPGWQLLPQLRRTQADSTVELYQYRRTVVQLVLRKDFP